MKAYSSDISETFSGSGGQTVQISADFNRLSTQYNATQPANTPTKANAPAASQISCPAQNSTWLASTTLPPTPNEAVCNCVNENALACRVRQATADKPIIVGSLTDYACSLLGGANSGASCITIGGNGSSGQYGPLSYCSPAIKLSFAFSAYYEYNPVSTSCDFSSNATLASTRPSNAAAAQSAAQSCLALEPPSGVFTPSASSAGSSPTSSPSSSGASSSRAAAMHGYSARSIGGIVASLAGVGVLSILGGMWVLV